MGYTTFTKILVKNAIMRHDIPIESVLDYGSQNDYDIGGDKPPFISDWYKGLGVSYDCIDLAGDNNAHALDLAYEIKKPVVWDLVVDAGTGEHLVQMEGYHTVAFHEGYINSVYPTEVKNIELGYYNGWLNKFKFCRVGGLIISENPKSGHWKDHAYSYIETDFYVKFVSMADLKVVDLGEHGAMGNWETGINVYSVLKKTGEKFPTFEEFSKLPIYKS